ncbi:bifunctional hydroxymethylpyrimidine kinase/phosphomethylpyrimidine kinase [Thermodesulfobacteriota bacterium]
MKFVLVIAGSDSSGGAGVQADIKTISSLGAHALTAISAVTAQSSQEITSVHRIPARFISRQVETILKDVTPHAVKIGMLYSVEAVLEIAGLVDKHKLNPVVLDPVMESSSGRDLLESDALLAMKEKLIPLASVVTPNLHEAGILSNIPVGSVEDMIEAAKIINTMGPDVIVTGGHLEDRCIDVLFDGKEVNKIEGIKIDSPNTHGSGCVFASSLATFLAQGRKLETAAKMAHDFTKNAIKSGYSCGKGAGPVLPLKITL